jgi:hypothetical protein
MTLGLLATDMVQILCSPFPSSPKAVTHSVASAHPRSPFTTRLSQGEVFAEQKPTILMTSLQGQGHPKRVTEKAVSYVVSVKETGKGGGGTRKTLSSRCQPVSTHQPAIHLLPVTACPVSLWELSWLLCLLPELRACSCPGTTEMLVRSEPYCVFPLCSCAVVVHVSSVLGKLRQEDGGSIFGLGYKASLR